MIAVVLPYLLAGTTVYFRIKQFGKPDLNNPRTQAVDLQGPGARANAAQANAWEALAVFAAAVLVAHLSGADADSSATAATVFIGARILHPIFYIADIAPLRTVSFVIGFASCI